MVLDTSAIIAAIAMEPDAIRFRSAILGATSLAISAVTVLESKIVLQSRHGKAAVDAFDQMLEGAGIAIVPFDAPMAQRPRVNYKTPPASLQPDHDRIRRPLSVGNRYARKARPVRLPGRLATEVGFADRLAVDEPGEGRRAAERLQRQP